MIYRIVLAVFCFSTCDVSIADIHGSQFPRLPGCDGFADKLDSCEPFICEFKDPNYGEMLERKIVGMKDGKCLFQEEFSKVTKFECRYSDSYRKAVAQYWRNNNPQSVMVDTSDSDVDAEYIIDGKEIINPLMEQSTNGVCRISHNNDSLKKDGTNLEIEWRNFKRVKDSWNMDIEITNNQNKMVILNIEGTGKERNWRWGREVNLDSGESTTLNFKIDQYFSKEIAYDIKKIAILAYECGKISKSDEKLLCSPEFGVNGIFTPWKILENREVSGASVIPTSTITKYFRYNSLENPPIEVGETEFLSNI